MSSHQRWAACLLLLCHSLLICRAQESSRQWSEAEVIERFLADSPQAVELRARVAVTQAEVRTRSVYPNPSVAYSRESAGYNEFFEASQTVPLSGRIGYLRQAGTAVVSTAEANRDAALWSLRSDLRIAFYRIVGSQERLRVLASAATEVDQLVVVLRRRETEGESSRYDRVRAEREASEVRVDHTAERSVIAVAAARLASYLPEGTQIQQVSGDLPLSVTIPSLEELVARAMKSRADYVAEQRTLTRYQLEERAARTLRIPEPQVTAGLKRAELASGGTPIAHGVTGNGFVVGLTVPIPVFNAGRYEVARYQAEQEQANARMAALTRRIRTEIEGARNVLNIRREVLAEYQREVESAGAELIRITQLAYQEGEAGILELLDSLRVNRAARLRLIDLQAGVKEALIELERAAGEEFSNKESRP